MLSGVPQMPQVRKYPESNEEQLVEESSCRYLLLAIIERALRDAANSNYEITKEKALKWLYDERKGVKYKPFSFLWICDQLDLRGSTLLRRIHLFAPELTRYKYKPRTVVTGKSMGPRPLYRRRVTST